MPQILGTDSFYNIESFTLKQLVQSSGDIELISRDFDLGIDLATAGGSIGSTAAAGLLWYRCNYRWQYRTKQRCQV